MVLEERFCDVQRIGVHNSDGAAAPVEQAIEVERVQVVAICPCARVDDDPFITTRRQDGEELGCRLRHVVLACRRGVGSIASRCLMGALRSSSRSRSGSIRLAEPSRAARDRHRAIVG